jgi:phage gp45-like
MDSLKILYLYSNKIQKIQNETFDNLKNLENYGFMK